MTTGHRRIHLAALLSLALYAPAHGQIFQQWLTQWGSSGSDYGLGVAVDAAGTTWVTGYTNGSLGGANVGGDDIFLTQLNATGVLEASVQRGGTNDDRGFGVAVVGGNTVFAVGYTNSPIWDGAAVIGGPDALVVGYSTAEVWQSTKRFGSTLEDFARGAAGNATHLLVAGHVNGTVDGQSGFGGLDAMLSKRDSGGALVWTRVVGTSMDDYAKGAAFDNTGNAYMAGLTLGSLPTFTNVGNSDLFVARYDASGTRTLLKQWGTIEGDVATGVAVDGSGNIYVTGGTGGFLDGQTNSGQDDAFLTKLDSYGNVLWTRLLGGTGEDFSSGLALNAAGEVWIGGSSTSSFAGHGNAGLYDSFVASYDSAGTLLGTFFWGDSGDDQLTDLAVAPDGSVRVSGYTGTSHGTDYDAWAASFTTAPEPTTPALLLAGAGLLLRRRRA